MHNPTDPKRLWNDRVPGSDEELSSSTHPLAVQEIISDMYSIEPGKGDPRLIDHVHFEHCPHETFSEEFCVPSKGHHRPRNAKRAKDEGGVLREDVECLCNIVLSQDERKGYWEIRSGRWPDSEPLVVLKFETLEFVVECESNNLVRISAKDVAAMLGTALGEDSRCDPVVKKVTATWISHTDEDKAIFRWEIRGPKKAEEDPTTVDLLQQKAKAFFMRCPSSKGQEREKKREKVWNPSPSDLLARCTTEIKSSREKLSGRS